MALYFPQASIMKNLLTLAGGLTGALILTGVHQLVRQFDKEAPRMDLMGEEAVKKSLKPMGIEAPKGDKLYYSTMAGDIVANTFYYSLVGIGNKRNPWARGIWLGLAAGIGGVLLPTPLGLNPVYSNKTNRTRLLTVAYYLLGGLASAAVMSCAKKKTR